MRLGVIGSVQDPQSVAMQHAYERLGHTAVVVEATALDQGFPVAFDGSRSWYGSDCLDDIWGWFLRSVPAPFTSAFQRDTQLTLYKDWYIQYMQSREKATYFLSWLLQMEHRGVTLVNGPHSAGMMQSKPLQLHVLRSLGAEIPKTLITNDPGQVRAFHREVQNVIFKPVTGGAETQLLDASALQSLDLIKVSPVIFQERVWGDDVRVVVVGDEIVSSVAIETPSQHLDFRADPVYSSGQGGYREVTLPSEIQEICRQATRECGLVLSGIDIKLHQGKHVFLELNSAPVYLDVELKMGHPITDKIARFVAKGAEAAQARAQGG